MFGGDAMRLLLPPWAPNLHPLLVHFPIALLFTGAGIDALALLLPVRARAFLREVSTALYVLGAVAALAAYLTGRAASQTVLVPGMAQPLVTAHWNWALWTVSYFGGLAAVRLALLTRSRLGGGTVAALAVASLVGLGLLYGTAERGARLVYEHGVGVGVLPPAAP
jgi:uncharacterized membrane protein